MKSFRLMLPAAILLLACTAVLISQRGAPQFRDTIPPASRVQYKAYSSALMKTEMRYGIYLPPSYEKSNRKYPVLYFLHGLNENEMRWSTRGETDLMLDGMIKDGKIGEFIVAVPYGANSFYTNVRAGGEPWEDVIVKEFIPMVESTYRINAIRAQRGISGISMGGYGALKIAMKHPEMFGSVSAHSAALVVDFANMDARQQRIFNAFGPRIYGINQDLTYWDANNPMELAKDTKKFQGMKIYFDCGTEDDYGFFIGHKALDDLLTRASYPHEAHLYPGNHGWDFAKQHTVQSLLFHWKAFGGN